MSSFVYNNAKGGLVSILVVGVGDSGNDAVENAHWELSDLANPDPSVEQVDSLRISRLVASGNVTIRRGATSATATDGTIVIKTGGRYNMDLREGMALTTGESQNLTVQVASGQTAVLQCSKSSRFVSSTLGPDEATPIRR